MMLSTKTLLQTKKMRILLMAIKKIRNRAVVVVQQCVNGDVTDASHLIVASADSVFTPPLSKCPFTWDNFITCKICQFRKRCVKRKCLKKRGWTQPSKPSKVVRKKPIPAYCRDCGKKIKYPGQNMV